MQDTDALIVKTSPRRSFRMVLEQLQLELKDVYTNRYLYKYIIWVCCATGIYFQVNAAVRSSVVEHGRSRWV